MIALRWQFLCECGTRFFSTAEVVVCPHCGRLVRGCGCGVSTNVPVTGLTVETHHGKDADRPDHFIDERCPVADE